MKLPPFAIERYFARYEFSVEHLLCCSDCETTSVRELLALEPDAHERLLALRLGYTDSRGAPELRSEIARLYRNAGPEDVLVCVGAEEGIFLSMHAALEPGDHIVVPWPCYQSLAEVARSTGCEVSRWTAHEENGWALDPEELRGLLTPRTKLIVLNSPHNPTGYLMRRDLLEQVAKIAAERGIMLFSDEVYRGAEYSEEDRLPAAVDLGAGAGSSGKGPPAGAVSLGVMSKTYGLPGLRIGWLASHDRGLLERISALRDYTTICASAPSEMLAALALRHAGALAGRNRAILLSNLALLDGFFKRNDDLLSWQRPRAGPVAFPRLLAGDAAAFCDTLVKESGVLLLPGTVFGDEDGHFRIGFGRASMPAALERLEDHLRRRGRSWIDRWRRRT